MEALPEMESDDTGNNRVLMVYSRDLLRIWQVRKNLGYESTSYSYMHFLATTLFNLNISESLVDIFTAILIFLRRGGRPDHKHQGYPTKKNKHH